MRERIWSRSKGLKNGRFLFLPIIPGERLATRRRDPTPTSSRVELNCRLPLLLLLQGAHPGRCCRRRSRSRDVGQSYPISVDYDDDDDDDEDDDRPELSIVCRTLRVPWWRVYSSLSPVKVPGVRFGWQPFHEQCSESRLTVNVSDRLMTVKRKRKGGLRESSGRIVPRGERERWATACNG